MIIAIIVSFLAGGCVVMSRMINADLANHIGVFQSTFFNYIVGLFISILFFLFCGEKTLVSYELLHKVPFWAYLGGVVGVSVVILSNITSLKMPAFYLTLLLFIGQLITGIVIDLCIDKVFSWHKLLGGLLVFSGLAWYSRMDEEPDNIQQNLEGPDPIEKRR